MGTKTTTLKNGTKVTRLVATVPEWRLQSAQVRALRAMPEFGKRFTLAGDQAAAKRTPQGATIAKATGLVKGEHDVRIYLEGGRLALIENKTTAAALKKKKTGGLDPAQVERHALLYRLGFTRQTVVIAATEADAAEQAVTIVRGWLSSNDNGAPP